MLKHANLDTIVGSVRAHVPSLSDRSLDAAVVLGSGMSPIADEMTEAVSISYGDIDGFEPTRVAGHSGRLVIGDWNTRRVAAFCGRFHYYEGHDGDVVTLPVQIAHALGATRIVLTTAVGGLNPAYRAGDVMLISDHINLIARNPLLDFLRADSAGAFVGERSPFVNPRGMYHTAAAELLRQTASLADTALHVGVLAAMSGPAYETEAEKRMLRTLGADAVCMSTAPEALMARYLGMTVFGFALVTNEAWRGEEDITHADVLAVALRRLPAVGALIAAAIGYRS